MIWRKYNQSETLSEAQNNRRPVLFSRLGRVEPQAASLVQISLNALVGFELINGSSIWGGEASKHFNEQCIVRRFASCIRAPNGIDLLVNPEPKKGPDMEADDHDRKPGSREVGGHLSATKRHLSLVGGAPYLVIGGVNGMVTRPGSCGGSLAASALQKLVTNAVEHWILGTFYLSPSRLP
jgi:hypothetical protein